MMTKQSLAGRSPGVGVIGSTIGRGISWLGRAYGLAAGGAPGRRQDSLDEQLRHGCCQPPRILLGDAPRQAATDP